MALRVWSRSKHTRIVPVRIYSRFRASSLRAQGDRCGERKEFLSRQNLCSPIAVTGAREERRRSGSRAIFPTEDERGRSDLTDPRRARGSASPLEVAVSAERT